MTSVEEQAPAEEATSAREPTKLSVVSKQYDLDNKGYLDSTELQLRQLDTQNEGHLTTAKVYQILTELKQEQKKNVNMRKIIFALSGFAVLLALANVGTSFAAATLAKDTTVDSSTGYMTDTSGSNSDPVGVTAVVEGFEVESKTEAMRRSLTEEEDDTMFFLQETAADRIFGRFCRNFDRVSYDPETFVCTPNAQRVTLHSCGHSTVLQYVDDPVVMDDGIVYSYAAWRGNWNYGEVQIVCNDNESSGLLRNNDKCRVEGLLCARSCTQCGQSYWLCGKDESFCGCQPGACSSEPMYCPMIGCALDTGSGNPDPVEL